jgi:AraC-like DNA-binding protein
MKENSVDLIAAFPDFKARGFDMKKFNQQFREKNLVISARSKRVSYDRHWGGLSLKFAIKGNEYYQTDHSKYAVNNSNFLILNKDTEYSSFIDSDTEVESLTLNFSDKFTHSFLTCLQAKPEDVLENNINKQAGSLRFTERLHPKDDLIFPYAYGIHQCLHDFDDRNDEIAELFGSLLMSLLQLNKMVLSEIDQIQKVKLSTKQELYRRLHYAKDFIDSCYNQEINLDTMSGIACLNTEYFIRQFKSHFQITPAQYLIKKRMEKARLALLSPDISISEICQEVGYSDLTSFGKLFKRYYKISPTDFRKNVCR